MMAIQNWYAISTQYTKMKQKRKMNEVRMPWTQMKKKAPPHRAMVYILHRRTRILGKTLVILMMVQFHFETRHYGLSSRPPLNISIFGLRERDYRPQWGQSRFLVRVHRVMMKIVMKIAVRKITHCLQNTLKMVRCSNIVHDTLFQCINWPRPQERLAYYIGKDDAQGDPIGSRDRQPQ